MTASPAEALAGAMRRVDMEMSPDRLLNEAQGKPLDTPRKVKRAPTPAEVLAALDAAGWAVVPKVATEEMLAVMEPYAPDGHHCFEAIIRLFAARLR